MIYLRYILEFIITKVWAYLTAWLFYPLAFILRKPLRWFIRKYPNIWLLNIIIFCIHIFSFKITIDNFLYSIPIWINVLIILIGLLWLYLNDGSSEDGLSRKKNRDGNYNLEFFWQKIRRKPSWWYKDDFLEWRNYRSNLWYWLNDFVISYKWSALRNPFWNIYRIKFFQVPEGDKTNIAIKKSICFNEKLRLSTEELDHRELVFKFEDGSFANKDGPYFDFNRSVLGVLKCTYRIGKRKLFRWEKVDIKRKGDFLIGTELKFGYTDKHMDFFRKRMKRELTPQALIEFEEYEKIKSQE